MRRPDTLEHRVSAGLMMVVFREPGPRVVFVGKNQGAQLDAVLTEEAFKLVDVVVFDVRRRRTHWGTEAVGLGSVDPRMHALMIRRRKRIRKR